MDKEMECKLDGEYLVIRLPLLQPPTPSNTGKSLMVATTNGNVETGVRINGKPVLVGINAYIRK